MKWPIRKGSLICGKFPLMSKGIDNMGIANVQPRTTFPQITNTLSSGFATD